ncbi:MAG: ATP-binding cassette domain-containing protein, partial [Planctomycetota bacterium]
RVRRGGFDLQVEAALGATATGLFGPSGAGKSTLLLALAGLVRADALRLVVGGEVVVDTAARVAPPAHRRRVGLVFQDHRLFPHRSVEANLRYGSAAPTGRGPDRDEPDRDEVIERLDLGPLLGAFPRALSGGQRQRVALGRALLAAPRILLLDEPFASLDRGLRLRIVPFLRDVRERYGLPMLVVGHDLADLFALTDETLLLDDGRLVGQGSPIELATSEDTLELLHDCGISVALPGRVVRRDEDGLAWVELEGERPREIACGDCDEAVGAAVEVVLRPEDVVLAAPPLDARLSLTNAFGGAVTRVTRTRRRCMITVDCGFRRPLLAEVTDRAVRALDLAPGAEVIALCKAQATRARSV